MPSCWRRRSGCGGGSGPPTGSRPSPRTRGSAVGGGPRRAGGGTSRLERAARRGGPSPPWDRGTERESTRLNSSHPVISYAVFFLKKKKKTSCNHHLAI